MASHSTTTPPSRLTLSLHWIPSVDQGTSCLVGEEEPSSGLHRLVFSGYALAIPVPEITTSWYWDWFKKLQQRTGNRSMPKNIPLVIIVFPRALCLDEISELSRPDIGRLGLGDLVATLALAFGVSPSNFLIRRPQLELLLEGIRTRARDRRGDTNEVHLECGRLSGVVEDSRWHELYLMKAIEKRQGEKGRVGVGESRPIPEWEAGLEELGRRGLEAQLRRKRLRVKTLEKKLSIQSEGHQHFERGGKREGECVICWDNDATISVLNCGHLCLCAKCSTSLTGDARPRCPICRQSIKSTIRIFRSS